MYYVQPLAVWEREARRRVIVAFLDDPLQSREKQAIPRFKKVKGKDGDPSDLSFGFDI